MAGQPLNVAVVGTGISGLSAAWLLSKNHRVTVFERDSRLGGHSNTVEFNSSVGRIPVDTGFIVFNKPCYPNLVNLFETLGVAYQATDMSFGISIDDGRLEYAGADSLRPLFAQKRNLFRPRFWSMIRDLLRFYRESADWLDTLDEDTTLGELLTREGFGPGLRDDHLIPMGAAIWSTPADQMLNYPARSFLRFCNNHGLLQVNGRPQWQTVVGGSREYVSRLAEPFQDNVQLNCGIQKIKRHAGGVTLTDDNSREWSFDHVVLASHADQSLAMLADPSVEETRLLSKFRYEPNTAYLHSDPLLMPRRKKAWGSWSYLSSQQQRDNKVAVSYWMNQLQHLEAPEPVLVTLNPWRLPRAHLMHQQFEYQHPVFDREALNAQSRLWSLQGQNHTWFCGSYFGHGFHEDGLQAGLAVAEALGGEARPWVLDNPNSRITVHDIDATQERAA